MRPQGCIKVAAGQLNFSIYLFVSRTKRTHFRRHTQAQNLMDDSHEPVLIRLDSGIKLSLELIRAVNRTYLLHLLTLDPDKVLPPGKSLIAVITQEKLGQFEDSEKTEATSLRKQVKKVMQRAFWDVVRLFSSKCTDTLLNLCF